MTNKHTAHRALSTARSVQAIAASTLGPPDEGLWSRNQQIIPLSVVRGTRGYIERVANQANGCYDRGWYDACAVMIRRLVETLIIETFEHYSISQRIKNSKGDFFHLRDLITATLSETSWNLGRNTKRALPKLKGVGDKSAHSRRFNAHKKDIQKLLDDIRVVVQELIYLAGLKRSAPRQGQTQGQTQGQPQGQTQGQPQGQPQAQSQAQPQKTKEPTPANAQNTQEEEKRAFEALTLVFQERNVAVLLVEKAGFPTTRIPSFTNSLLFWTEVAREARNGALPGGIEPILIEAAKMYPNNPSFVGYREPMTSTQTLRKKT